MKMSIIDFYCLMVSDFFVVVPICRCPFWLHRHGGGKRRSPARTAAGTASSCELGQGSLEIMSCRCTSLSLLYGLSGVRAINIVLSEFMAVCGAVFFVAGWGEVCTVTLIRPWAISFSARAQSV